jgi:hypothetical protein
MNSVRNSIPRPDFVGTAESFSQKALFVDPYIHIPVKNLSISCVT